MLTPEAVYSMWLWLVAISSMFVVGLAYWWYSR